MKRITRLACALLLVPTLAVAEPTTPAEWYKEGETQYNLGNFSGAVDAFKKGFALETNDSKKSAYLYNIAQSYRQAKDCSNAQFFYKRFLALRDADKSKPLSEKTRKDVEDRIKELEECARQQEAIRNRPPDGNFKPDEADPTEPVKPDTTKPDTQVGEVDTDSGEEDDEGDGEGVSATVVTGPRVVSLRVAAGGAMIGLGDDSVTRVKGALLAGYPIPLNAQLRVEVGAGFTFTSVAYESMQFGTSGTASLTAALANAGVVFAVTPEIAVRGDLGAGMLFLGGASKSQFVNGNETSGTLAMPHVRAGAGADYAFTPNLAATLLAAFSYSPAKDGMREDISAITSLDLMVGLGYRM